MSDGFHLHARPADATMTVTKAAQVLGVHPNTVRAWSEAGRLRYYRINPRGDRRYRMTDLQRFLAGSLSAPPMDGIELGHAARRRSGRAAELVPVGRELRSMRPALGDLGDGSSPTDDRRTIRLLEELGAITASALRTGLSDPEAPLQAAARTVREVIGLPLVAIWRLDGDRLTPAAVAGPPRTRLVELPRSFGVLGRALAGSPAVVEPSPGAYLPVAIQHGRELACAIASPSGGSAWGVLLLATGTDESLEDQDRELACTAASALANLVAALASAADVARQLHRAEALRRVAADIGSRLDLEQILAGVIDHAMVLLGGDRAAVYLFEGGEVRTVSARGLSAAYQAAVADLRLPGSPTLASHVMAMRRPLFSVHYRDDPRAGDLRAAVIQEGFDTVCLAPMLDGDAAEPLGALGVYHDRAHPWTDDELDTLDALATQAAVAIKAARTYQQLATWAAQLQSIQQLGARLSRLSTVAEIGTTIATELRQLIDYHNVRVYRLYGDDLIPVAMQGQVGEYVDETPEQLRVKFGAGITGWVAEHRVAQLL
ncbi:MAG TPA: GAF domain-containing protein, partial [Candidatus Limnocylindrales bacterium]|nr:GAF domain-containing protein [Candidatus Limnocylindrales bacterium]